MENLLDVYLVGVVISFFYFLVTALINTESKFSIIMHLIFSTICAIVWPVSVPLSIIMGKSLSGF